jgi:hypothetical protein
MPTLLKQEELASELLDIEASNVGHRLIASGVSLNCASSVFRRLITSGLALSSITAFSAPAFANTIAAISLSGYVPTILEVTNEVNIAVPLDSSSVNNQSVGSATLKSNSSTGYTVTVRSANDGVLKMISSPEHTVHSVLYTFSYDGQSMASLKGSLASPLIVEKKLGLDSDVRACAINRGCQRSLSINVNSLEANGKPAGTYTDTLKFDIMAND